MILNNENEMKIRIDKFQQSKWGVNCREGILEGLKFKSGLFKHISGPRLGATLIMNKNGLLFLICSSMTLRRPQTSLDSIYFQEDMKNLKKE